MKPFNQLSEQSQQERVDMLIHEIHKQGLAIRNIHKLKTELLTPASQDTLTHMLPKWRNRGWIN